MPDPALANFERLFGPEFGHGKDFDLARLKRVLDDLGAPHTQLPPVIHVAGTNGKGSTIAFLHAIAAAAGLKVHAFTKPHLFKLNERFVVAGETASDDALAAAAERLAEHWPRLSQFDAQIGAAFLLFSATPADLTLLETGMGGRDDSTNIIDAPALSVLTPIGLDHQDVLGATLAEIAAHKAGILKPNVTALVARQAPEAMAAIVARAAEIGAPLLRCGIEWDAFALNGRLVVQTESQALDLPLPALAGGHQIDNAGLACAALLHWRELDQAAFSAGIGWARWPARLQPLTRGPLSAIVRAVGGEAWVDGGHNAHAADALARALTAMNRKQQRCTIAIIGMRARKDVEGFIAALAGAVDRVVPLELAGEQEAFLRVMRAGGEHGFECWGEPSLTDAMRYAAQFETPRVLICGSFLLAAEALQCEGA
jgi:dihydrofolate synthase / folylpolyglutamate synthase